MMSLRWPCTMQMVILNRNLDIQVWGSQGRSGLEIQFKVILDLVVMTAMYIKGIPEIKYKKEENGREGGLTQSLEKHYYLMAG